MHHDKGLSIVILAAGQGTRMKSSLPKVMHTIAGKPFLAHVIATAQSLNPSQIIVVYGYGGDVLKAAFTDPAIQWAHQPVQQGTADAVAKALPFIPSDHRVLILYGDVPLISPSTLTHLLNHTAEDAVGLLTVQMPTPYGLGRIVREAGEVARIVEEKDATEAEKAIQEVNTGIFLVQANALSTWLQKITNHNAQKEYYLTDIIALAVQDQVPVVTTAPQVIEEILGINDKLQQSYLERYYQQSRAKEWLKEGVWIADPARLDVRGTLEVAPEVSIDVNVVIEGKVTLRKGCTIGPHCVLKNCDIGEGVTLHAHCYLEGVTIAKNATIGPFARLRPGTVLAENVHIGNFVEVKNATVGMGSKINHLSYIGDATLGKDVNVGAGTITCNYDGAYKHQTIIEDDVHIGSDSQLIAPVRVGKGATLAAGTTLHEDAPPYQLTLSHRLALRSLDWQRPKKETTDK